MPTRADNLAAAYAQAFARAPVGIALVGADGRFRDVNRALCVLLARRRADLLGARFASVSHPDDAPVATRALRGEDDVFVHEQRVLRPDGCVRWVEVEGSVIRDSNGEPAHFAVSARDVTDRRRARELRNEHLASIAHELRTPLTSISGYAGLLADEGSLPTRLERDSVAAIERNAHAMLHLIEGGDARLARAVDDRIATSLGCPCGTCSS